MTKNSHFIFVKVTASSMALDYHFETGMLFWSDLNDKCIYKAPIDEGDARSVSRHFPPFPAISGLFQLN